MKLDQQHDIRNGVVTIWHASRWIDRNGELTEAQRVMVGRIQRECCRIGRAVGMSGIRAEKRSISGRIFWCVFDPYR